MRLVLAVLLLSGCAIVEEYRLDGTLESRKIGAMPLVVVPAAEAPAVRVRNLGASLTLRHVMVGYSDITVIRPDRACFSIIFVDSAREALRWASLATDSQRVCKGE